MSPGLVPVAGWRSAVVTAALGTALTLYVAAVTGRLTDQRCRVAVGATMLGAAGLFAAAGDGTHPFARGAVGVTAFEWGRAAWTASSLEWPDRRASHPFAAGGTTMGPMGAVSRSVVEALRGSPSTRRELDATIEAETPTIDRALNELQARGVVVWTGRVYRIADDGPGLA